MLDTFFTGLYDSASSAITLPNFFFCILTALALGAALTLAYTYRSTYTKGFVVTLAMLPAVVCVIIMMVSGNLGAGVAVAGTFSLVRFRSAPGTAKEICAIFLAMAVGLATGMGYLGFAALFAAVMIVVSLLYSAIGFGGRSNPALCKKLRITIPEDLDYGGVFDDLFAQYTSAFSLVSVKTTNMGSLFRLTYHITLREAAAEKKLIDDLRCRNGNLEISSSLQTEDSREL